MASPKRKTAQEYVSRLHDIEIEERTIREHENSVRDARRELDSLRKELGASVDRCVPQRVILCGDKVLIIRWVDGAPPVLSVTGLEE